ncbi:MAG TPA: hypothetical protein VFI42_20705 [Thermomicrobiaceae bacterium]|nr:hypothetical protein [Thermomicrobiaceae bacterium]
MSIDRLALRARQIRALYQRELTALHRDPSLSARDMTTHEAALWRQTAERLASLRQEAEHAGALSEEARAVFAPPPQPEIGGGDG